MSRFLWVEDFEVTTKISTQTTADQVLGKIIDCSEFATDPGALKRGLKQHGVFVELNLQDSLDFIAENLNAIDYVILDIDLPAYGDDGINEAMLQRLIDFEGYQPHDDAAEDESRFNSARDRLKKIAGFYAYTQLIVELGFPKQHILICSNHADQTQSIKEAFIAAKATLPDIYLKSNSFVGQWVKEKYDSPYSRLRRGIIEGCNYLLEQKDNLRFNQFIANEGNADTLDIENYLLILKNFFPLRQDEQTSLIYQLFVRTLSHEWQALKPGKVDGSQESLAFSWIMKITRNWSAHSQVFAKLQPQDVGFLFIVNMRAFFDLGDALMPYERCLLTLFGDAIERDKFIELIGTNYKDRKIPLTQKYAAMLDRTGDRYEAINFHDALNNLQQKNSDKNHDFLIKGLYQVFWFLTSYGHVYIDRHKIHEQRYLNYQFRYYDYQQKEFVFEIGRHIYQTSFPEGV